MPIRVLNAPDDGGRVETGPVQFGEDWPGIFIRGDNAGYLAWLLRNPEYQELAITQLSGLLASPIVGPARLLLQEQGESELRHVFSRSAQEGNALINTNLINIKEVMRKVSTRKTTIYKLIGDGLFPKPIKVGRSSLWLERDIDEWVEQLAAKSHKND